jgi:hypothetical protein
VTIFRTTESTVQVDVDAHRYRSLGRHDGAAEPVHGWTSYDQMSPIRVGEPVRFMTLLDEAGSQIRYHLYATEPVTELLDDMVSAG